MSLVTSRVGFCGLALSLFLALSCGGQRIRLGGGIGEAGAATGAEGGGGSEICARGQVSADEVLWIGDSWIIEPGAQRSTVKDLAFAAGTIAANEEYPSSAAAAASMAMIAQQYDARQRGTPQLKVLLMDGGTWDPIAAQMAGRSVPAAIDNALTDFRQFLAKVATDGTVEHIVYVLVPELMNIPGVAEMRPPLKQACVESVVRCHFIDLQDVWEQGDPARYTAANGFLPTAAGGVAMGEAIWATMQANCIAQ